MSRIDDVVARCAPDGVEQFELGQIAGYSDTRVDATDLDGTNFVGVDNLLSNKAGRVDADYEPNTARLTAYEPGDVLLGNIRPYLKKVWYASNSGGCSGDVLAVRVRETAENRVLSKFLYYLLSSDQFFTYNTQHSKGAKMPRGSKDAILRFRIPVPPLEVQSEIVSVLDQFQELEAELRAELNARRLQYGFYRNALLTSGKPTMMKLGDIADFKYGFTASAQDAGDYRFIRITDINSWGKLSPEGAKFVSAVDGADNYLVEPGDLLMARTGATYGKTMLVDTIEPAIYASFLIRIRLDEDVVGSSYYWHFAQSDLYWSQANTMVSTGGQPQFNANVLKLIEVPVPSLEAQAHAVAILDQFDALVNDLTVGLPAELNARHKQYELYRDKLLTFKEVLA